MPAGLFGSSPGDRALTVTSEMVWRGIELRFFSRDSWRISSPMLSYRKSFSRSSSSWSFDHSARRFA